MFFPSYSESSKFGEIANLALMLLQNCVYDPSIIYLYLYHIIIYTILTILFYKWEASKVKVERRKQPSKVERQFFPLSKHYSSTLLVQKVKYKL